MSELYAFLYILAHVVFGLVVLHYFISAFCLTGRRKTVVPISSSFRATEELYDVLRERMERKDFTFIDLGCGSGRVVLAVAREFPNARAIGIDHNPEVLLYARLKKFFCSRRYKNVRFISADLWNFDVGALAPDVIYTYFGLRGAAKLGEKLARELTDKTLIISNKFQLPGLRQIDIVNFKTLLNGPLYIYKA